MSYELGQSIKILNPVPWIDGMVVNQLSEITDDPTRFEGRVVYVKDQDEKYWFVDWDGNPRALSEFYSKVVQNLDVLANAQVRRTDMVAVVKCYDLATTSSTVLNAKLLLYTGADTTDANWQDFANWIAIGGTGSAGAANAAELAYSNTTSGLTATNVQAAIDEMVELIGAITGGTGALTEEVVAVGVSGTLGIPDGTSYPTGMTFTDWLKSFVRKVVAPTYSAPTATLTKSVGSVLEIGSTVDIILTANYTKHDGGNPTNYTFEEDNVQIATQSTPGIYTVLNKVIPNATVVYDVAITYAEGDVKQNNIGEDDPTGQIPAGTLNPSTSVRGDYLIYGGGTAATPAGIDDAYIKANNIVNNKFSQSTSGLTLDVAGAKTVWIAVPPGKTLNTAQTKNPATNEAVFATVAPVDVTVNPSNNSDYAATYKLYKLETALPWAVGTVFNVVF